MSRLEVNVVLYAVCRTECCVCGVACVCIVHCIFVGVVNINLCHRLSHSHSLFPHTVCLSLHISSSPLSISSVPPSHLLTLPLPLAAQSMPLVKSLRLGLGITVGASKKSSDDGTGTVTNSSDHENGSACTPMQMSRSSKIQPMNSPSPCEVEHSEHE